MKLGKMSILLLTAGIVVIAFASLGIARAQQLQEQDRVSEELSLVQQKLNILKLQKLRSRYEELEEQLSQATSQSEAVRAVLSQPIGSIGATDDLFTIARDCGVEISGITSSDPVGADLEGVPCSVLTLNVSVEGDLLNLISFIIKVNGDFATGTVESAGITVSDNTTEPGTTAAIKLLVYTYQGG